MEFTQDESTEAIHSWEFEVFKNTRNLENYFYQGYDFKCAEKLSSQRPTLPLWTGKSDRKKKIPPT